MNKNEFQTLSKLELGKNIARFNVVELRNWNMSSKTSASRVATIAACIGLGGFVFRKWHQKRKVIACDMDEGMSMWYVYTTF